jgi:F420-dependent oxidoreductase-like protein
MKIGLQIPNFTWPGGSAAIGATLAEIASTADESGFASLWVMDHFFQIRNVGATEEPMLESYATLGYMAAHTKRATLGTMVTGVVYRHPGILVKTVSTLDVLSGGRAWLGIGAAWNEEESRGLGIPFPPVKERFERLEEALRIALQMWSGNEAPFEGDCYHLERPLNSPQPITKPHPPILIGGMGEKKTLRLVARYADACNLFGRMGPDLLRQKLDVLKRHCDEVGRPYEQIEKTVLIGNAFDSGKISPKDFVAECRSLRQMGFTHAILSFRDVATLQPLELAGREVIPHVAEL